MRLAIVAAISIGGGAVHVAEAGHHCTEVSKVVGYQQCHRFGDWSTRGGLTTELGVVALRFDANPIDGWASETNSLHLAVAPGDGRQISARGLRFRHVGNFGAWYFGLEGDAASITDGPQLVADGTARDMTGPTTTTTMTTSGSMTGWVVDDKFTVGRHARYGAVMFGVELSPGARFAEYSTGSLPKLVQMSLVFEAKVRADVWVAPNFTLGAIAGVDLVQSDAVSFAIMLGAHLVPYDRTR